MRVSQCLFRPLCCQFGTEKERGEKAEVVPAGQGWARRYTPSPPEARLNLDTLVRGHQMDNEATPDLHSLYSFFPASSPHPRLPQAMACWQRISSQPRSGQPRMCDPSSQIARIRVYGCAFPAPVRLLRILGRPFGWICGILSVGVQYIRAVRFPNRY